MEVALLAIPFILVSVLMNSQIAADFLNPNPPSRGGGMESEPPELLFSLVRLDFLRCREEEEEE